MKTFQELTVGVFVVYIALAVLAGGFANAAMILGFSVICTAGIALVLWIPLCIGVGKVGLMVAQAIARGVGASNADRPLSNTLPATRQPSTRQVGITNKLTQTVEANNRSAIETYIRRARRMDYNDDQIFNSLRNQGWTEAEIHQAYQTVAES